MEMALVDVAIVLVGLLTSVTLSQPSTNIKAYDDAEPFIPYKETVFTSKYQQRTTHQHEVNSKLTAGKENKLRGYESGGNLDVASGMIITKAGLTGEGNGADCFGMGRRRPRQRTTTASSTDDDDDDGDDGGDDSEGDDNTDTNNLRLAGRTNRRVSNRKGTQQRKTSNKQSQTKNTQR